MSLAINAATQAAMQNIEIREGVKNAMNDINSVTLFGKLMKKSDEAAQAA